MGVKFLSGMMLGKARCLSIIVFLDFSIYVRTIEERWVYGIDIGGESFLIVNIMLLTNWFSRFPLRQDVEDK